MENKFCGIVLLLLLLLTHELMIHTEARKCFSKSRHYHGRCFFRNQMRNCKTICKQESFMTGKCIRGTCFCWKTCGGGWPPHPPPSGGDGGEGGGGGDAGGGGDGGSGGDGGGGEPLSQPLN